MSTKNQITSGQSIQSEISSLTPLELAVLVSSIADEHLILRAPSSDLDATCDIVYEICNTTFGRHTVVLDEAALSNLERFGEAVLADDPRHSDIETLQERHTNTNGLAGGTGPSMDRYETSYTTNVLDSRKTASVVIAKRLHAAAYDVQIQALELMRSRRIFSRTAVHTVPKRFLFIALIPDSVPGPPYLTPHLNDHFFISHTHDPSSTSSDADSLRSATYATPDAASISSQTSVIHKKPSRPKAAGMLSRTDVRVSEESIGTLQALAGAVRTTAEIRRYTHNIPTFLRLHRAVKGGITAVSTRHLTLLSRILAPLHGLNYVPPSMIGLAAKKVYAHRLELVADPKDERSMLWGSEWEAVAKYLAEGEDGAPVTVDGVLEEGLKTVEVPL